jgi:hypothetical protein
VHPTELTLKLLPALGLSEFVVRSAEDAQLIAVGAPRAAFLIIQLAELLDIRGNRGHVTTPS